MEIHEISLYHDEKNIRKIKLKSGLNIITGRSSTGKTALGDIIEYCLGSSVCNISKGLLRNSVKAYGMVLNFGGNYVFIARESPGKNDICTLCYFKEGAKTSPDLNNTTKITNDELVALLSAKLGIIENYNQTRKWDASIKHTFGYCFQSQNMIFSKKHLFHRQSDHFYFTDFKMAFQYFLGVFDRETLSKIHESVNIERKIEKIKIKKAANNMIKMSLVRQAKSLMHAANERGITLFDGIRFSNDLNEIQNILEGLNFEHETDKTSNRDEVFSIQNQITSCEEKLRMINLEIANMEEIRQVTEEYRFENFIQHGRLKPIGIFENTKSGRCPICNKELLENVCEVDRMKSNLCEIEETLAKTRLNENRATRYMQELDEKREEIKAEIRQYSIILKQLFKQEKQPKQRDYDLYLAQLKGNVEMLIRSIDYLDVDELSARMKKLEEELDAIKNIISDENLKNRKDEFLSQISCFMNKYIEKLESMNAESLYRLDSEKMTVAIDTKEGTYLMSEVGSGYEWLCCHLVAMLGLHNHFIKKDRPVPRFLFLDQPSLVNSGGNEIDEKKIKKVFHTLYEASVEMPSLQIIVVDHADIKEPFFYENVIQRWWDEEKLIPQEWVMEDHEGRVE